MTLKKTKKNDPQQEVLRFGNVPMTLDDMSASLFCNGGSGAGKTTSVLKLAIKSLFRLGIGGLFSTAKIEDCDRVLIYAKETGRSDDVIVIDPSGDNAIDLIQYILDLTPEGSSRAISFTEILKIISEVFTTISKETGEAFWRNERDRLAANVVTLIEAAEEQVSAILFLRVITSIPQSTEQMQSTDFLQSSTCMRLIDKVIQSENDNIEVQMAIDYLLKELPTMGDRTRSSILADMLGIMNRMVRGLFPRILGAKESNVTPEMVYEQNKIIILNTPPALYGEQGTIIQALFVYAFMKRTLQRSLKSENNFGALVCDEFQTILSEKFLQYVSVSRSSRIINIFATQSIAACRVKIGGMHANEVIEAFLGNMRTKIMMAHAEPGSNKYSAELIGQHMAQRKGFNVGAGTQNMSSSATEFMKYLVEPYQFGLLKNGGKRNNYICEAYIMMTGRTFEGGLPYMKVAFDQRAG